MKQVNKSAYNFKTYLHLDRWVSYHHQIQEVLSKNPSTILEIGVGDGVLKDYLQHNSSVFYTNVDVAEDLHPDVIGSVDQLPFKDNEFDMVVAFEVLEHLPFGKFDQCIREMSRVSKKHVLISLPHFGPPIKLCIKIPFLPQIKFSCKIPFPKTHVFNGQHYCEIGKKGYSTERIRSALKNHFLITKEFIPFENQYHHFFILEKKI